LVASILQKCEKYFSTIWYEKLNFNADTNDKCKKGKQLLVFFFKKKSINIDTTPMKMLCSAFIKCVVSLALFAA